jgi:hypothetical protein
MLAMSLPTGQQKVLERIEGRLAESDPRLTNLFSIFTRLALGERMPWFEQIRVRPVLDRLARLARFGRPSRSSHRRPGARVRAMMLLPAALLAMAFALTMAFGFSGGHKTSPGVRFPAGRELVVKGRSIVAKSRNHPIITRTHDMCRAMVMVRTPALAC